MMTDLYTSANYHEALNGFDHNDVQPLAHQTWTPETLCVESFHEQTKYYTSRWDGLCPYIDVTPQMLAAAQKPASRAWPWLAQSCWKLCHASFHRASSWGAKGASVRRVAGRESRPRAGSPSSWRSSGVSRANE